MSGKIQNEDIKSSAELAGAGGSDSQLPNDTKAYVTAKSLNKKLSQAIIDGDFSSSKRAINAQVGTTYTFVLADGSDAGKSPLVTLSNASPITATVPLNASVAFPIGTQIDLAQIGAGKVTVAAAGGVTINSKLGNLSVGAQYVGVTLVKIGTDSWLLLGDLIA